MGRLGHVEHRCGNKRNNSGTETEKNTLDDNVAAHALKEEGNQQNEQYGHHNIAHNGDDTAAEATQTIANGGCHVDGEDTRQGLGDGEEIVEFLVGNPPVTLYQFALHEWNHGVAATDGEGADFEKTPEYITIFGLHVRYKRKSEKNIVG